MSNPLYRYLQRGKTAGKKRKSRGGNMARRRKGSFSRGFGGGSDLIGSGLKGMGAAALAKRFVGAPLGSFTGAAAGFLISKNIYGALGGFVHDNIGNVGGSSAVGGGYLQ